ncbi:MYB binding protein 1a [Haematobia irritans]|uniref:MYB binding protein 1a n=1 Tax=Haematobia irritans TaxID=7368 RepID=UPI003F508154
MNLSNKMKVKKDKKVEKGAAKDTPQEENINSQKVGKKIKIKKHETPEEDSIVVPPLKTKVGSLDTKGGIKSVDTNIFKYFKELTNDEEKLRLEAASNLVQQLSRSKDEEKKQKELQYSLKRLVRGCGSSTNISRSGFYIGLLGVLKSFGLEEVPLQQVLDVMNKELHVGSTIVNKEDADAVVGKILVVGALLHSGRLADANSDYLEQVTNILLQATHHKSYHASLGYSFICELIETLSQKNFESSVWPLLQKELAKPWPKQNLQSVHCIIALQKKFPNVLNAKFLKTHFGGGELLNADSYQSLHKIFWMHSNTDILTHPAFEYFGSYIATSKNLSTFWTEMVEPGLENPTKLMEIVTLKILTDILDNLDIEQTNVHELMSDNFMRMFIEGLKNLKQKKDETLKAFYGDFLEALVKCCNKLNKEMAKVAVIKRLILPPGVFNIEKFTSNRIVHQLINGLGEEGVKEMFNIYKSIFLGNLAKNPENSSETWLNFERLNAGYMLQHLLQHKAVHNSYKWRVEQLKFLLTCGVFYVSDAAEICKKESAGSFSKDFADQCKNMFYTCLQVKMTDIDKEQQSLWSLAQFCQEAFTQKHAVKCIRIAKFEDVVQKPWKLMYDAVAESEDKSNKKKKSPDNKLQNVFNILLLNMGLQLFREPDMATPAIDDLLKCMTKTKEGHKKKSKKSANTKEGQTEEEPEWIEVVVDLFLHLLSQNNSALRNIVNALFPHLCDNLTLSAVHQILAMLDMKDGHNPLSSKNDDDDSEEDEGEEEEDEEDDDEDENNEVEDDEDEDEEMDDDDDDEDDEEDDEEDGEVTETDKLRNAISQALMANGSHPSVDDDMESVDLNDMTEEEGRKLDEALAKAFKAIKKTGSGTSQIKKSKSYRVKTTTVMHFRIRVLDLIEIYLQQKPSLLISIEIMLALFNMLEYCVGDELKPLQTKVEKTLLKLTTHKNYVSGQDLKEENFVDFLRLIVEKKAPAPAFEIINRMRNKCCCFLISNAYKINGDESTPKILSLCEEYTQEFIKSRNPIINITLLSDIFKLRWRHIWDLADSLAQQGISLDSRTFRRIQVYEILSILYKNNDLQKHNEEETRKHFKKIEKALKSHINSLNQNKSLKQSPKEFQTLLELVINAQRAHNRLNLQSVLTSEETLNAIQNLRKLIRLENTHIYQRFCGAFRLTVIRNSEVQHSEKQEQIETESDDEGNENGQGHTIPNGDQNGSESTQKRKVNAKDLRKLKKQKKMQRMEAASRGLNGGIGFTQRNGTSNPDESDADST